MLSRFSIFLVLACSLLLLVLFPIQALGVCGDADNNGSLSVGDPVYIFNWLRGTGSAPASFSTADADGYQVLTMLDISYIFDYIFAAGNPPVCPPTQNRFVPYVDNSLNVTYGTSFPAGVTSTNIEIDFANTVPITPEGLSIPCLVTVAGSAPSSMSFTDDGVWPQTVVYNTNITGAPAGHLLLLSYSLAQISAGTHKLGTLTINMPSSSASARAISLTYTMLPPYQGAAPANEPMVAKSVFVKSRSIIQAGIPLLNGESGCGDADGSGSVSIADAVFIINFIFGGGPAPGVTGFADVDCSGNISIADAVYLINYIFGGGPAPCANCS